MDSLVPFQDLNHMPDPQASTSSAAGATSEFAAGSIVPKIEPKTEPVNEWPTQNHYAPAFVYNSQNAPIPASSPSASAASGENDVYAEFNRVAELFRSAFAARLNGYNDLSAVDVPDSRAIVAVPESYQLPTAPCLFGVGANRLSDYVSSPRPAAVRFQRPQELARIGALGLEDQKSFREIVRRTRMIYDCLRIFLMTEEMKQSDVGFRRRPRGDLRASSLMRERGLWLNQDKHIVGSIPGIHVGDLFFYRMELCVVGLHGQPQAGIDYLTACRSSNGEPIATSIIVSGGYEDDEDVGNVLIYTGHGGQDKFHRQCQHQKLEGGNLAMERSRYYGIEVRVIRGFKYDNNISSKVYVYDGLYRIVDCWFDVGKSGFGVFKFKLVRMEGQPEMGSTIMKFAQMLRTKPLTVRPTGYISFDLSCNKEKAPVYLYNDMDADCEPLHYEYIEKSAFPPSVLSQGDNNVSGCDCVSDCNDECLCARKNGGQFAYDYSGNLMRGKPVIFECGTFCKCSLNCRNRVTQKGLKTRLEVFRSKETGWGVRSLDLIQAGAFICEYAGVALTRELAQIVSMNGDTLVYPGQFTEKWGTWGDLSQIYPDYVQPSQPSLPPLNFAMDVSRMRNVACYISHSNEPNVLVQFVLYDHNNLMFPRIMLFALENIPPLVELSLDYGVADEFSGKLALCN